MEKMVIVGNGSSMLDEEYGEQIDKFDLVCRMNRGFFEGIDGYEKNVGNRTDMLIVHDGFMTDEYMSDELFENIAYILVGTPAFKWESEVQRIKSLYNKYPEKIVFIPTSVEMNLKKEAEFGSGWPSTGLLGTYHILNCFDMDVTLIGFDGYPNSDKRQTELLNSFKLFEKYSSFKKIKSFTSNNYNFPLISIHQPYE